MIVDTLPQRLGTQVACVSGHIAIRWPDEIMAANRQIVVAQPCERVERRLPVPRGPILPEWPFQIVFQHCGCEMTGYARAVDFAIRGGLSAAREQLRRDRGTKPEGVV